MTLAEFWASLEFIEQLYIIVMLCFIPIVILGLYTSYSVGATFRKYSKERSASGESAIGAARKMLDQNDLKHVPIQHVQGELTDHYDPRSNIIALSDSTYSSRSIAAIGVACHEAGHACQHDQGYLFSKVRLAMVPVVNFSNKIFMPILIVGMLLAFFVQNPLIGNIFITIGMILFGSSTIFMLITLPTEFNASSRALRSLSDSGNYSEQEIGMAKKVLKAAAMTYVAAFLMSAIQFLRFFLLLMMSMSKKKK